MNRTLGRYLVLLLGLMLTATALVQQEPPPATTESGTVAILTIDGAIGPATSDYFLRGIERAQDNGAKLVVLVMDTPGGLDSAMRDIIKGILSSSVPIVTFVSPSGSRAASAGTYILYASHIAAMSPATNLGAATPVQIGGQGKPGEDKSPTPPGEDGEADDEAGAKKPGGGSAMERKAVNDAIAYIRSLAEMRGRNADWAEAAVRTAQSLSATEALEKNVIDLVATDLGDLLKKIDGRTVNVAGMDQTVSTDGLIAERIEPDWRTQLLDTLTNPNVAYLLMLIGIYGLIFEGYNPGAIVPGVVGAICLLLALYAFQVLSVNYAGLALIALGLILIVSEVFVPSFGALGIGGIVAFVFGSIILIDTDVPGFGIDRRLIGAMAVLGGGLTMGIVWFAVRARNMPVVTGRQELIGAVATANSDFDSDGTVFVHGERWSAQTDKPVRRGDAVRIVDMHGLLLKVTPYTGEK